MNVQQQSNQSGVPKAHLNNNEILLTNDNFYSHFNDPNFFLSLPKMLEVALQLIK